MAGDVAAYEEEADELDLTLPPGPVLNPKVYVERGTGFHSFCGYLIAIIGFILLTAVTWGVALVGLVIGPIVDYFRRKKALAALNGSAVRVGPGQLQPIHDCAKQIAQRLGMSKMVDIYVVESNTLNAVAGKVGGRQVIVLIDDIVNGCLMTGNPGTLAFILAHEMAHHALGHTRGLRGYIRLFYRKLSRLDEFSCDAIAKALVQDSEAAVTALTILLIGPQLLPYVGIQALRAQAREVEANKYSAKAEKNLSHPLMMRRIARLLA